MRIVNVPGDVHVDIGNLKETISFRKFVVHQLDTFDGCKTREQVRQADKIVRLVEGGSGDAISFEDADFAVVDDACKELRYIPEVKRRLIPFLDALENPQKADK
jgi:hypothetical protein